MQAGVGLAPTTLDGRAIDPFTGLAAPDELLRDLAGDVERLESVRCETDGGVPLYPHDVLRATLAGHVRRVVLDGSGRVVSQDPADSDKIERLRHLTRQRLRSLVEAG